MADSRRSRVMAEAERRNRTISYSRSYGADRTAEIYAEQRRAAVEARMAAEPLDGGGADSARPAVGYLVKQGQRFKNWKRRFFALTGTTLRWYDSEDAHAAGTALGEIDVVSITPLEESCRPSEAKRRGAPVP